MLGDPVQYTAPVVVEHDGIFVARDDLYPGGTKARFLGALYGPDGSEPALFPTIATELVYASPAEDGAQTALAYVARAMRRRATIFTAARAAPHARTRMAAALGARIEYVRPGYLSVVQARAAEYCARTGARLVPFGCDVPYAVVAIAGAARRIEVRPAEVWCASGSGVLARAMAAAFPSARRHVVQVGRRLLPGEVAGAQIHVSPLSFGMRANLRPPFPSDPHYDAKAWELCRKKRGSGTVLFWNVTGPAKP
jgi:hypothetical protein